MDHLKRIEKSVFQDYIRIVQTQITTISLCKS